MYTTCNRTNISGAVRVRQTNSPIRGDREIRRVLGLLEVNRMGFKESEMYQMEYRNKDIS